MAGRARRKSASSRFVPDILEEREASAFQRLFGKVWNSAGALIIAGTTLTWIVSQAKDWTHHVDDSLIQAQARDVEYAQKLADARAEAEGRFGELASAVKSLTDAQKEAASTRQQLVGAQRERIKLCKQGVRLPNNICDRLPSEGAIDIFSGEQDSNR